MKSNLSVGKCKNPEFHTPGHDSILCYHTFITVQTLNIGTPRLTTVVVLNIKQFNFTMQECLQKM